MRTTFPIDKHLRRDTVRFYECARLACAILPQVNTGTLGIQSADFTVAFISIGPVIPRISDRCSSLLRYFPRHQIGSVWCSTASRSYLARRFRHCDRISESVLLRRKLRILDDDLFAFADEFIERRRYAVFPTVTRRIVATRDHRFLSLRNLQRP